jgi:MazG family protein
MAEIKSLLEIMAKLRDKQSGCPWDVEQTFESIAPHTLEEAYEVVDAIERDNMDNLKEELGDLLLQVVFHSQMAKEQKLFDFNDVVGSICDKLIRRHPHVFGDADIKTAAQQTEAWDTIKEKEQQEKNEPNSILNGIAIALPALLRAYKLQKKAAKSGFDWPSVAPVLEKLEEEIAELKMAIAAKDKENMEEELGDMLFVCVNIAKHLDINPEDALRYTNRKFEKRFYFIERELDRQHRDIKEASLQELDDLWDKAKLAERAKAGNAA